MYRTIEDINCVAYLMCLGFKPTLIKHPKIFFEFLNTPEVEEACLAFYEKRAQVEAITFGENIRAIKMMIRTMAEVKVNGK